MPRAPPNRAIALPPSPGSAWWVPSPHSLPTLPEFPRRPGPGDARGPSGGTLAKKFLPLSPAPRGRRRPLRRPAMLAAKRQDGGLFKGPPYPGYPFIMIPDLTSPYLPNGSLSPTARTVSATALPALPALLARPPAGPACPAPPPPRPSPLPSPPRGPNSPNFFSAFCGLGLFALRHVLAFLVLASRFGEPFLSQAGLCWGGGMPI